MGPGRERQRMEARFGALGQGLTELVVQGAQYDLYGLLRKLGMDHADIRPIDAHYAGAPDSFVVRYFDFEDRVVVAFEFDGEFAYRGEHRVHIDEWMGEDYYTFPWAAFCPDSP